MLFRHEIQERGNGAEGEFQQGLICQRKRTRRKHIAIPTRDERIAGAQEQNDPHPKIRPTAPRGTEARSVRRQIRKSHPPTADVAPEIG